MPGSYVFLGAPGVNSYKTDLNFRECKIFTRTVITPDSHEANYSAIISVYTENNYFEIYMIVSTLSSR